MAKSKGDSYSLFDKVAPIYGLFYGYQKSRYGAVLNRMQKEVDLLRYQTILDVGCGTGALCSVLHQRGFCVTGVDPAKKMLDIGARKRENRDIGFIQASALERMPFRDKSFDVSMACYVAHGLKDYERKMMYAQMERITKHVVIIYDYNERRSVLTNVIEWLEGGDYFDFIKNAKAEMEEVFKEVQILNVGLRGAWYVCGPKS